MTDNRNCTPLRSSISPPAVKFSLLLKASIGAASFDERACRM